MDAHRVVVCRESDSYPSTAESHTPERSARTTGKANNARRRLWARQSSVRRFWSEPTRSRCGTPHRLVRSSGAPRSWYTTELRPELWEQTEKSGRESNPRVGREQPRSFLARVRAALGASGANRKVRAHGPPHLLDTGISTRLSLSGSRNAPQGSRLYQRGLR